MSDIYRAAKRDQECNRLRARIAALRNEIQAAIDRCPPSPSNFERGVDGGLKSALIYIDAFDAEHPVTEYACGDCRHWGGEPDSAKLGSCHISGSFRAPGGLFTEADFCCCHWTTP